ncbi:hypothetical protein NIES4071_26530 [Calothrix sp. NIES-4071]|nr:hypothetical protein NIES4071_26530 [Calothrix sp. NIES-4071]BAZ56975.1 hypothetical protein NIES4105_26470 [Calothrix sp. NIES-4105]
MNNLVRLIAVAFLIVGTASPSLAGDFRDKVREFQSGTVPGNCPEQKIKSRYLIYTLCKVQGKPAYLQIQTTEASEGDESGALDVATFEYKNGQLVGVFGNAFDGYGFRNNKLVAAWKEDKYTTNVSSKQYKDKEKSLLAQSRKILGLFKIK